MSLFEHRRWYTTLTNDKRTLLHNKVNNMPKEIKKKFDMKYQINWYYIAIHGAHKTTPSQKIIDDLDEWFSD